VELLDLYKQCRKTLDFWQDFLKSCADGSPTRRDNQYQSYVRRSSDPSPQGFHGRAAALLRFDLYICMVLVGAYNAGHASEVCLCSALH
jgi:hypothetical protein